ncbi:MAG: hypothetical protein A4E73_02984 [Syntrophaceae bacterium PtaU1.Bin231]|nr:MAG: hypothetical protein A4E73_02984 [Syntrophaceae bacterium PtaU1.Bin231]
MEPLSYGRIDDDVLRATGKPRPAYFAAVFLLGAGVLFAAFLWLNQVQQGMFVTNLHQPVDWGVYLGNFIYWVGLAHSGTLISAIFFLCRARWRDAVSRATEAMTIIAIGIAGLFPLIHLGRFWVVYYIVPYPSQRQIWPNFISPLLWDVLAISTYLTVSILFFYIGLIPDAAAFRDTCERTLGPRHWRTRLYRFLASGWSGAGGQWRHYQRSYLYFAALVTPLVISVHSIVSWDFAVSLLNGWHTTMFAPYFVAGAIHSGLAMGLILLIPLRKLLHLERLIRIDHLDMVARTILVTTAIMAYSYAIEPFAAWYSGDRFEIQFTLWRATGGIAPVYWSMFFFNVLVPLCFLFRKARRTPLILFTAGVLINIGMWLERVMIVVGSLAHDFMPHNWSSYLPTDLTEAGITVGSFCLFFFAYLVFAKTIPAVALSDLKENLGGKERGNVPPDLLQGTTASGVADPRNHPAVTAVYRDPGSLIRGIRDVMEGGFRRIEYFSPIKIPELSAALGQDKSPVRFWTLAGALIGGIGGFVLAIGTANVNALIVGGKHPVSLIPYCIIGFEGLILVGSLFNLAGFMLHTRPYRRKRMPYNPRFSRDGFALVVFCNPAEFGPVRDILSRTDPEDVYGPE